jgi:hypothetical protein
MSSLASAEKQWMEGYYGSAVGLTITKFEIVEEDDFGVEYWPVFTAVDKDGVEFRLEISRDPEGNGPGFMFGLTPPVLEES